MGIRWLFATSVLLFAIASVCVAFVPRKLLPAETAIRMGYRHLTTFPAFLTLMVLFAAITVVIFIPWTFLPLYLKEVGHMDSLAVGALVGILFLGSVLCGAGLSRARRRFGSLAVILTYELLFVVSAAALLGSRAFPGLAVACFLRGGFWSFRQVMTAVIGESLPFQALPKGYGVFAVVSGLAAALAYPIGGWLYGNGMAMPFVASGTLMLFGLLATLAVRAAFAEPVRGATTPPVERALPEAA
jgi:MFS family permease